MALEDSYSNLVFFLRWFHILAGITWIGLLYFFNFINGPFQTSIEAGIKPQVNTNLIGRTLWWFRWGAMYTFLFGWTLFLVKYGMGQLLFDGDGAISERAMWILFGGTLGSLMWFNVWFIIWPAQKQILGGLKSGTPHPDAAALAKRAGLASKANTFMSGPMLFGMIAPNNYASINLVTLIVVVVLAVAIIKMFYKLSGKVGKEFA